MERKKINEEEMQQSMKEEEIKVDNSELKMAGEEQFGIGYEIFSVGPTNN